MLLEMVVGFVIQVITKLSPYRLIIAGPQSSSSPIVVSASQAASLLAAQQSQEAHAATQELTEAEAAEFTAQGQVDGICDCEEEVLPQVDGAFDDVVEEVVLPQVDGPYDPTDDGEQPTGKRICSG